MPLSSNHLKCFSVKETGLQEITAEIEEVVEAAQGTQKCDKYHKEIKWMCTFTYNNPVSVRG